jgi:hypothetical protein
MPIHSSMHRQSCPIRLGPVAILVLLVATSCGSGGDKAVNCAPSSYELGCVGDGRRESTPADQPVQTCSQAEYTYFSLEMSFSSSVPIANRDLVERCVLTVVDASGNTRLSYTVPSGETSAGTMYGCPPAQVPSMVGRLSYSSCCAGGSALQFTFTALAPNQSTVATGTASAPCTQAGPTGEVHVSLQASAP